MKNTNRSASENFVCVNCWGRYEYGDEIAQPIIDLQRDVNGNRQRHHFIKDWLVRFVDGVMLRRF